MNKEDFIKTITLMAKMYNKEFDLEQATLWYSFFKDTNSEVFKEAIRNVINKSKYMPTVADLKEKIESIEQERKEKMFNETIEKMKIGGYFSTPTEYEKIMKWYQSGIIPSWFKEDMKKYENIKLGNKEQLMLEVA